MPASPASRLPPRGWSALGESTRALCVAAALYEQPLPIGWLDALGATDADVDNALAQALLQENARGLALHPKVDREGLVRAAAWSQRRRLHLALAHACMQAPARFDAAARHFEAGGKPTDAARAHLAAAETCCRRRQHADALRHFSAGLRLLSPDTPEADAIAAVKGLERCAALARDPSGAITLLNDWRVTPPWRDRPAVRAEAASALAALLALQARHVESAQARRDAARELVALERYADSAAAAVAAATTLTYAMQLTLARETAAEAIRAARRADRAELQAQAAMLHGLVLGMQGETRDGRAEIERALDLALAHRLPGLAAEAYRLLGTVAEYASCYRDEQKAFSHALAYCRRHDQSTVAGLCLGCLSYSLFRSGNWKRSEETIARIRTDRKIHPVSHLVAEGVLGLLQAHRGETRHASRLLQRSLAAGRRAGIVAMDFFNLLGLALVAEVAGRPEEAAAHYAALQETWRTTEDRHDVIPGFSSAAIFFAGRGERDRAAEFAENLEFIASATANPEAAGAASAAAAELHLLDGKAPEAVALFRAALKAYEQRDLSIELIRIRTRLGDALQKAGAHDEARAVLRDAARHARRLGARPFAQKAEALLANTAAKEEPHADGFAAGAFELLSLRQREVGRHLAQGLANKEIAAQLGLSVRTVEMHVADVLNRLDCRSRTQAAARIAAELK